MKLSAYTIAKNCTGLKDVRDGIDEINNYIYHCETYNKKPCDTAYIRLHKLDLKSKELQNKSAKK